MSGGGQQGASGRMGAFTSSSSSELPATYKKNAASSSIQKGGRRWRPNVFDFKSGANTSCPTCQGTGHIPKGLSLMKLLSMTKCFSNSHTNRSGRRTGGSHTLQRQEAEAS